MEMVRADFLRLAEERLVDAQALFATGRFGCAYYIAGYAVECALKACIPKQTRAESFPQKDAQKYYSHNLDALLGFTGLEDEMKLDDEDAQDAKEQKQKLKQNWIIVRAWSEASRYESDRYAPEARRILEAIEEPQYGVLTWLRNRW
jgi:HEPN domain-containing protein